MSLKVANHLCVCFENTTDTVLQEIQPLENIKNFIAKQYFFLENNAARIFDRSLCHGN